MVITKFNNVFTNYAVIQALPTVTTAVNNPREGGRY